MILLEFISFLIFVIFLLTIKLTLRLFDLAGRFVNEQKFLTNDIKIDMSNYANGIYILSFYNFCGLFKSFKVVVNK